MLDRTGHGKTSRADLSRSREKGLTRREMLSLIAKGALAYPLLSKSNLLALADSRTQQSPVPPEWRLTDDELLEEIVSRAFLFFWNEASPRTGLVRDRALADGTPDNRKTASIAATGLVWRRCASDISAAICRRTRSAPASSPR